MKKHSVLVRRAILFTAIVVIVAIAVGLPVYLVLVRELSVRSARELILPQARTLAEAAASELEDSLLLSGEASLFAHQGGVVWLSQDGETRTLTPLGGLMPLEAEPLISDAARGSEYLGNTTLKGERYVFAVVPVWRADGAEAALVAAIPTSGTQPYILAGLGALLVGLILSIVAALQLERTVLEPVVRPIAKLRDVAVAVADGNLEARANEKAPGEIGEMGKALNKMSYQLARNMYTLILERNRLKHMLDGLSEGIVAIDNAGHVTHTNPALARMFTKQKLALHLPDPRMKLIPDKSIWEDFDNVIRTGEPLTRNMELREMTLRLTITPTVDEIGAIAGAVGLISDITQMERLERTRRDYVSNVSHELRTPLTAMRALIEPLKEGMVNTEADRQRYYDIILREVMRLSRLINDQLELSRLQSGTLAIQKSYMTIDDLIYDVCDRYASIAHENGLELNVLTDFSKAPTVYTNADRIEQMLIILLDNAIKYAEEGSVNVSASWDDEKVTISVRDTGVGIEEEDLPYVFDRFYKVDKAHSGKGSGLGLSIARELLKRMGEDIWATSEKGGGTEFCFTVHRKETQEN